MKSGYDIIWSEEAFKNLEQIIKYLGENFSEKEIKIFIKKLEKRLTVITEYPLIFPSTNKIKNLHKSVLKKQIVLYYQFDKVSVRILSLFDSRQHTDKLKL